MRIDLKAFTELDFETLKSWVGSEEELFQFAGKIFSYPLTDGQLTNYIKMGNRTVLKVVLKSTGQTIGHCELNFEHGNARLSRIIIGKSELRGKGLGEEIVRCMVELVFRDPKIYEVDLNVFDWNKGAIKCYEKVGFKINHSKIGEASVNGKIWSALNMVLQRNCAEETMAL
ncbi:RimJ/RimL family protein N-acetyltransferase [Pedobacter sp. UYP30]|uniref:GNAT family N-acetyltransferase n=1 Tax=Pedobacter sp. UYP30 TaxID=1756400 RepID=UPI00339079E9